MTDKMRFETPNFSAQNVAKIAELFPGIVSEGKVNFELLRTMLGDEVSGKEAYEFTWVGKRAAIAEAGRPIRKTLRPCKEESRDWDNTENLYIEGDNLDVLKLLQESYLGEVKMIYIDPPYNTGNDFIYNDDFTQSQEEYEEEAGVYNEAGDRRFKNTQTNGRFHSDWCSMMYPRLVLARNLLRDDGVIFISIDDNEVAQLRKICDEVFGEENFISNLVWQKKFSRANDATFFSTMHDHILCYCKINFKADDKGWRIGLLPRGNEIPTGYSNPDQDPRGVWTSVALQAKSGSAALLYEIITPNGRKCLPPSGRFWSVSKESYIQLLEDNRIWFGVDGKGMPRKKTFLSEVQDGLRPNTIFLHSEAGHNQEGKQETKTLFNDMGVFDGPKPVRLLNLLCRIANVHNNDIILDFFSGSATTAHAVMQLNSEDDGKRKYIMVQLPEITDEKTEAYKAGYKNICEIGKERIRRAGDKIKDEAGIIAQNLDIGFRVLKLDDSNMRDVYYSADETTQDVISKSEHNIKEDRNDMDLLFGCLLDLGLPLTMPHTSERIDGFSVHTYNDRDLIACFEEHISEQAIREIAERKPLRAVFRDSSFTSSQEKINVFEIFKLHAPNTTVKVI